VDADTVEAGRFDFGRMWTFEYPPTDYFRATYGFEATPGWFERARLAALRIPGCSAAFVSPRGLVVTNHHCARGAIASASREGEDLLDEGFYARRVEDERPLDGVYADQLVHIEDVTAEIHEAVDAASPRGRSEARARAVDRVRARLEEGRGGAGPVRVEVVALYDGGRYSAYVFRRFTDVRLVAAAELELGFFGGDPDNFTYPRYALDFAFYRVYGDDGLPYRPDHWFTWGEGVEPGDAVFVIGNPGPTNRLNTVAQLEYQRDVFVPVRRHVFETRLQVLRNAVESATAPARRTALRNRAFSLSNSLKAYTGRLEALQDPVIMARKAAAERELAGALAAEPELELRFGPVLERLARVQEAKRELSAGEGAFYLLGHRAYGSRLLARAAEALQAQGLARAGAPHDTVEAAWRELAAVDDHPGTMEVDLLTLRLADLARYLGPDDPLVGELLGGRSPAVAALDLMETSVLARQESTAEAVARGGVPATDPGVALARALLPRVAAHQRAAAPLEEEEGELAAELGRARFAVYGTRVAPDATFSPRITDGVVRGYAYNGTEAPPYTTFFGLYDHHYSYPGSVDWELPDRWLPVPDGLELSTPLNFVSTADTYGGNSGSPAVTEELALVGLNFDRNIEGLSRDFIYLPERGRNVMVDVRAIREALDVVYDADRIVHELLTGELVPSEAEADALRR
jgi:hypothetical protein